MDNSALGERFLDYELRVSETDRNAISKASMRTAIEEADTGESKEPSIAAKAKNFIDNVVLNTEGVAKLHQDDLDTIEVFGNMIAYLRAKVERTRSGELAYTPLPEVPSRINKQLIKLYKCAPIILGKYEPDTTTYDLARHITNDIIDTKSYRYRVSQLLTAAPGQTIYNIVEVLQIDSKIVERVMSDMLALDMITLTVKNMGPGKSIRAISLKDDIRIKFQELTK
jgi:hypothetical protein